MAQLFSKADLSNMKYEGMFGEQAKKPRKYFEENGIKYIFLGHLPMQHIWKCPIFK